MSDKPAVSAKVIVGSNVQGGQGTGTRLLSIQPDYTGGRNKEWAAATPHLYLQMTVNETAAKHFPQGQRFTLLFVPEEEPVEESQPADAIAGERLAD